MNGRRQRRQREERGPSGFLVVDKPRGWTSHDVVDAARGWLEARQIGHLGTLDPLATGVLPLAVRSATKLERFITDRGKGYTGRVRLGIETDTLDAEGQELRRSDAPLPDEEALREALSHFLGEIEQIPPMFSAVKKDGVPLHKLAREGREVERPPKTVRIDRIELLKYEPPFLDLAVDCSEGTYVRTLAADLGSRLGCGAHLAELRRTRSGPFDVSQAQTPETLAAEAEAGRLEARLISPLDVLGLPRLGVDATDIGVLRQGGEIPASGPPQAPGTRMVAHDEGGAVVAIVELQPGRRIRPIRVLATS
jgi:tRNA pseudouridine55 synthase